MNRRQFLSLAALGLLAAALPFHARAGWPDQPVVQEGDDFEFYQLIPDNGPGRDLASGSFVQTSWPYAQMFPPGFDPQGRNILIRDCSLNSQGMLSDNQYVASLNVNHYSRWKILVDIHDPAKWAQAVFNVPRILTPHDYLCTQESWNPYAFAAGYPSWRFWPAPSSRRILGVAAHYSLAAA